MPLKAIIQLGHGRDCPYCGRVMSIEGKPDSDEHPTRDHIRSRWRGGGLRIIACRKCNLDKKSWSVQEWYSALVRAGDDRASTVLAFIDMMATGEHLKIIAEYEREAQLFHIKDKNDAKEKLERRRRNRAKKARIKRAKRDRDRRKAEKDERGNSRLVQPQRCDVDRQDQVADPGP